MKNTLKFYKKMYDPLFNKNYTKKSDRSSVALKVFSKYCKANKIKIQSVLDVGCAWGKAIKYWKKKGITAHGVDVGSKPVRFCKNRGYLCYLASATDLSIFDDKQFDLYMSTDVYEHLREDDIYHAIEEAKRVTKKYILIRPHPSLDKRGQLHLTVWSMTQWRKFFANNGLTIINLETNNNVILMKVN